MDTGELCQVLENKLEKLNCTAQQGLDSLTEKSGKAYDALENYLSDFVLKTDLITDKLTGFESAIENIRIDDDIIEIYQKQAMEIEIFSESVAEITRRIGKCAETYIAYFSGAGSNPDAVNIEELKNKYSELLEVYNEINTKINAAGGNEDE